jgi:RNA polymerase sigma factor (sigma-70 family)
MFLAKDKKLLEAFKMGDREAMDTVYRHYVAGVSGFLRKGFTFRSGTSHLYFKGIQDSQEISAAVQEVFRRAFEDRARQSYNGVNSFSNWVLAIARNLVINQFRNREISFSNYVSKADERGHLTVMDEEITEEFSGLLYAEKALSQDAAAEETELKNLVGDFMHELTAHEREVLTLRFTEGLGQEETAQKLGSTRMKVRTIEAKLRARLRTHLRNTGYIDNMPLGKKPSKNTVE